MITNNKRSKLAYLFSKTELNIKRYDEIYNNIA